MKYCLELSTSQRMALVSLIAEHIQTPNSTLTFIDVVADKETTAPDLLTLVMDAKLVVEPKDVSAT